MLCQGAMSAYSAFPDFFLLCFFFFLQLTSAYKIPGLVFFLQRPATNKFLQNGQEVSMQYN